MFPNREIAVSGVSLASVGLGDALVAYPHGVLVPLVGFPVYPGQGIVEALLAAFPECEIYVDERAFFQNTPIRIH